TQTARGPCHLLGQGTRSGRPAALERIEGCAGSVRLSDALLSGWTHAGSTVISGALPPAAAVLTVTTRSTTSQISGYSPWIGVTTRVRAPSRAASKRRSCAA